MKPVTLPMRSFHHRPLPGDPLLLGALHRVERPLVVARHYLDELRRVSLPGLENPLSHARLGVAHVAPHEILDLFDVLGSDQRLDVNHPEVTAALEVAGLVQDVGHTARHTGCEVSPGAADDDDPAAGHVLAAVVAHALHDSMGAAIAHGEPFPCNPTEVGLAARGAVEDHVSDEDVLLGNKRGS